MLLIISPYRAAVWNSLWRYLKRLVTVSCPLVITSSCTPVTPQRARYCDSSALQLYYCHLSLLPHLFRWLFRLAWHTSACRRQSSLWGSPATKVASLIQSAISRHVRGGRLAARRAAMLARSSHYGNWTQPSERSHLKTNDHQHVTSRHVASLVTGAKTVFQLKRLRSLRHAS